MNEELLRSMGFEPQAILRAGEQITEMALSVMKSKSPQLVNAMLK